MMRCNSILLVAVPASGLRMQPGYHIHAAADSQWQHKQVAGSPVCVSQHEFALPTLASWNENMQSAIVSEAIVEEYNQAPTETSTPQDVLRIVEKIAQAVPQQNDGVDLTQQSSDYDYTIYNPAFGNAVHFTDLLPRQCLPHSAQDVITNILQLEGGKLETTLVLQNTAESKFYFNIKYRSASGQEVDISLYTDRQQYDKAIETNIEFDRSLYYQMHRTADYFGTPKDLTHVISALKAVKKLRPLKGGSAEKSNFAITATLWLAAVQFFVSTNQTLSQEPLLEWARMVDYFIHWYMRVGGDVMNTSSKSKRISQEKLFFYVGEHKALKNHGIHFAFQKWYDIPSNMFNPIALVSQPPQSNSGQSYLGKNMFSYFTNTANLDALYCHWRGTLSTSEQLGYNMYLVMLHENGRLQETNGRQGNKVVELQGKIASHNNEIEQLKLQHEHARESDAKLIESLRKQLTEQSNAANTNRVSDQQTIKEMQAAICQGTIASREEEWRREVASVKSELEIIKKEKVRLEKANAKYAKAKEDMLAKKSELVDREKKVAKAERQQSKQMKDLEEKEHNLIETRKKMRGKLSTREESLTKRQQDFDNFMATVSASNKSVASRMGKKNKLSFLNIVVTREILRGVQQAFSQWQKYCFKTKASQGDRVQRKLFNALRERLDQLKEMESAAESNKSFFSRIYDAFTTDDTDRHDAPVEVSPLQKKVKWDEDNLRTDEQEAAARKRTRAEAEKQQVAAVNAPVARPTVDKSKLPKIPDKSKLPPLLGTSRKRKALAKNGSEMVSSDTNDEMVSSDTNEGRDATDDTSVQQIDPGEYSRILRENSETIWRPFIVVVIPLYTAIVLEWCTPPWFIVVIAGTILALVAGLQGAAALEAITEADRKTQTIHLVQLADCWKPFISSFISSDDIKQHLDDVPMRVPWYVGFAYAVKLYLLATVGLPFMNLWRESDFDIDFFTAMQYDSTNLSEGSFSVEGMSEQILRFLFTIFRR